MLKRLDHVNVYTHDLQRLIDWYVDILHMKVGDRPPFEFPGAWLYVEGFPVVHLLQVAKERANNEPGIEHFALTSENITLFLDHLDSKGVPYKTAIVPEFGIVQVNIYDPDGNHIHIDFAKNEQSALAARVS